MIRTVLHRYKQFKDDSAKKKLKDQLITYPKVQGPTEQLILNFNNYIKLLQLIKILVLHLNISFKKKTI